MTYPITTARVKARFPEAYWACMDVDDHGAPIEDADGLRFEVSADGSLSLVTDGGDPGCPDRRYHWYQGNWFSESHQ
jgi:hypothetical protein